MKEILFRGKSKETKKWVYGYFFKGSWYLDDDMNNNIVGIIPEDNTVFPASEVHYEEVYWDTVEQWSGLRDIIGRMIFEGDIVEFESHGYMPSTDRGVVVFNEGCFGIEYVWSLDKKLGINNKHFHRIGQTSEWRDMGASGIITYTYEIIGNIHDNPELMEVK